MGSELLPSEDEFETIINALAFYPARMGQLIANEEVLKATMRLQEKTPPKSENAKAFEDAFGDDSAKGIDTFLTDLTKELDKGSILRRTKEEQDKLTLLTAKVIRLRDECRRLGTAQAINDLLK